MLAMLGAMGVLLAGMALPMFFDDEDDEEREAEEYPDIPEDEEHSAGTEADTAWMEDEADTDPEPVGQPADAATESGFTLDGDSPPLASSGEFASELETPEDPVPPFPPPHYSADTGGLTVEGSSATPSGFELTGKDSDDLLEGEDGDDNLDAGAGNDTLVGGAGDDTLFGGGGDDLLRGGSGNDTLIDGEGDDTLAGGEGDDTIIGTAINEAGLEQEGRDHLYGEGGDDSIHVGAKDFVTGGTGADTFTVAAGIGIGEQAEIVDFEPSEDKLVLLWDDSLDAAPPELTLGAIEDAADMAQVLLDGVVVAHVAGAQDLRVEDIELVPMSAV